MMRLQVVYFTQHPDAWHQLARDCGLRSRGDVLQGWAEFDGDGTLAVHEASAGDPRATTAEIWLLVGDEAELESVQSRVEAHNLPVRSSSMADIGDVLTITIDGACAVNLAVGEARAPSGDVSVAPLIFTPNVAAARNALEALGLTIQVASETGTWVQLRVDGGGAIALHDMAAATNPDQHPIGLSLEHRGNLDAVAEQMQSRGVEAVVVDEAYNRTLRIATPDGWELWVNGAMTDFYGYTQP
ncbi:hypothetical protein [Microbacterium sp. YY-01]|uniref:hypothetical protein n=1 Tax=Microbacterium sp. YY-01 TaxID=3421634 RepID=UPI003D165AD6